MNPPVKLKQGRIAVVEDDADVRDTFVEYLQAQGYSVWGSASAEAFYKQLAVDPVDVVLLDISLPGEDGISVARHLRHLPQLTVIIVSARGEVTSRLVGLAAGADRYLVKPVDLSELVANIEAALRKGNAAPAQARSTDALWRLSSTNWDLTAPNGKSLRPSTREFAFLRCMFEAQGVTVTKEVMAQQIFGFKVSNSAERLAVLVARLRAKCLQTLQQELPVKTVHLVGYVLSAACVMD